jgi:hypothetical protein
MHIRKISNSLPARSPLDEARHAYLRLFHDWLGTDPAPEAVDAEITGTAAAMRQLDALNGTMP